MATATAKSLKLGTAESCTGGLIGAALTAVPGSSAAYAGGVVSYSNAMKTKFLGVPERLFTDYGAVSEEVARAMAEGARERLGVDVAVSVTGIAGPGGGSEEKPVGTVWIAVAGGEKTLAWKMEYGGVGRDEVRELTVRDALERMLQLLK